MCENRLLVVLIGEASYVMTVHSFVTRSKLVQNVLMQLLSVTLDFMELCLDLCTQIFFF